MKKYLLSMAVLAVFAVGFAASDEESSNESQQVEQKQETEAERKARKRKEMMEDAYNYGKRQGMQFTYYQECDMWFRARWFTPSTDEDFEIFKLYKKEYDRGFWEGHEIKEKMRKM